MQYLRQELEIRAGEKEIYVYNKQGDLVRTHKRSYTPRDWVIIPSDMPKEYKEYGYWTVPCFQQKSSKIGPNTRAAIDAVIRRFNYPVQSFRRCFGILRFAERYSEKALENCCKDAILAGKSNYSYIANTIATYNVHGTAGQPESMPAGRSIKVPVTGTYKDNDARYSLESLLNRQNQEAIHE